MNIEKDANRAQGIESFYESKSHKFSITKYLKAVAIAVRNCVFKHTR